MASLGDQTLCIYLDESGDLGWKPGSSQHLVIGTVCTRRRRHLRKLMARFKDAIGIERKKELKASDASIGARRLLLETLAGDRDCYCRAIVVHKPNVKPQLQRRPNLVYNYAAGLLLLPHISNLTRVELAVDPREQKVDAPYDFDTYLQTKLYAEEDSSVELGIVRPESSASPGIQAADFLCNAVFRHFERGENACYGAIQAKLELHRLYFP